MKIYQNPKIKKPLFSKTNLLTLGYLEKLRPYRIFFLVFSNGVYELIFITLSLFQVNQDEDSNDSKVLLIILLVLQIILIIMSFLFSSTNIKKKYKYLLKVLMTIGSVEYATLRIYQDKQNSYFLAFLCLFTTFITESNINQTSLFEKLQLVLITVVMVSIQITFIEDLKYVFYVLIISTFTSAWNASDSTLHIEVQNQDKNETGQQQYLEKTHQLISQTNVFQHQIETDIKNPNCSAILDKNCDFDNSINLTQIYQEKVTINKKQNKLQVENKQEILPSIQNILKSSPFTKRYEEDNQYQKFKNGIENQILKNLKSGILLVDSNLQIVYHNKIIKKIFSTSNTNNIHRRLMDIKFKSSNNIKVSSQRVINSKIGDSFKYVDNDSPDFQPRTKKQNIEQNLQNWNQIITEKQNKHLNNQPSIASPIVNIECSIIEDEEENTKSVSKEINKQLLQLQKIKQGLLDSQVFSNQKRNRSEKENSSSVDKLKSFSSTNMELKGPLFKKNYNLFESQIQMKKTRNSINQSSQLPQVSIQEFNSNHNADKINQHANNANSNLQQQQKQLIQKDSQFKQSVIPYAILNVFKEEEVTLESIMEEIFAQSDKMYQYYCWSQNDLQVKEQMIQNENECRMNSNNNDLFYYIENNDLVINFKSNKNDSYFTSIRISIYHSVSKTDSKNTQSEKYILIEYFEQNQLQKSMNEKEIFEYKNRMLASVSHELRTPLNCSITMLQTLINTLDNISLDQEQNLEGIVLPKDLEVEMRDALLKPALQSNYLLLNIINDIVDYGQISTGMFQLAFAPLYIMDVVTECADLIYFQATLKGLVVELQFDTNLPEVVHSDEKRIRQVLLNLLSNSLKFTEKGQITVKVKLEKENLIRIEVQDTGCGIPEESLQKLFETFGNKASQASLNTTGAGLGISIANNLAMGLGGNRKMEVSSQIHSGTTFSFFIQNRSQNKKGCQYRLKDVFNKRLIKWETITKVDSIINNTIPLSIASSKSVASNPLKRNKSQMIANDSVFTHRSNTKSFDHQSSDCLSIKPNTSLIAVTNFVQQSILSVKMRPSLSLIDSQKPKSGNSIPQIPSTFNLNNLGYDKRQSSQFKTLKSIPHQSQMKLTNIIEQEDERRTKQQGFTSRIYTQEVSLFEQMPQSLETSKSKDQIDDSFDGNLETQENNTYKSQFNYFKQSTPSLNFENYPSKIIQDKENMQFPKLKQDNNSLSTELSLELESCINQRLNNQKGKDIEQQQTQKQEEKKTGSYNSIRLSKTSNQNLFTFEVIPQFKIENSELMMKYDKKQSEDSNDRNDKEIKSRQSNTETSVCSQRENDSKNQEQSFVKNVDNLNTIVQSGVNKLNLNSLDLNAKANDQQPIKQMNNIQHKRLSQSTNSGQGQQLEIGKQIKSFNQNRKCSCTQILIVDDNDFNLYALEIRLKQYGFLVQKANSGFQALEKVKDMYFSNKCCQKYPLIFMDIDMPLKDGNETTVEILQYYLSIKETPPVISACTAYVQETEKKKALQSGMSFYLTKPIDTNQLEQILFQIVKPS